MEQPPSASANAELEARLAQYMNEHPNQTEYYRRMVKERPSDAVKTFMCRRMMIDKEIHDLASRIKPLIEEWVKESPGLHEQIAKTIQDVEPLHANVAYVENAVKLKSSDIIKVPPIAPPRIVPRGPKITGN